jgi:hypothetical protein
MMTFIICVGVFFLLIIAAELGAIEDCLKWYIDYIRDPARTKQREL